MKSSDEVTWVASPWLRLSAIRTNEIPPIPPRMGSPLWDVVQRCWDPIAGHRPTSHEILDHIRGDVTTMEARDEHLWKFAVNLRAEHNLFKLPDSEFLLGL